MQGLGGPSSILTMAFSSGIVVGGVLLILILCSVLTWAIIFYKYRVLRRAASQSREFLDLFWDSKSFHTVLATARDLEESPLANLFRGGYREWKRVKTRFVEAGTLDANGDLSTELGHMESVQRTLRLTADAEITRLERMLIFLATVASAAPFVGLFGTVWGIMNSFREIGLSGSANLAVVAPGISEALIATATGLAAAIPAVVAYNYFTNTIKVLATEMDAFSSEFLNIVSHHIALSEAPER
ncbi:MAG: protein TolQ [Deferrisomatales bacterium]|nr:protein TolQ [Deferrisomatales bacterium]